MRKYEVGVPGVEAPVIVVAEEASWDTVLKFTVEDRKVAVFFSPLWFREVPVCECIEVDAGGAVAFDRGKCKVHPYAKSAA